MKKILFLSSLLLNLFLTACDDKFFEYENSFGALERGRFFQKGIKSGNEWVDLPDSPLSLSQ
ncbi:MAG: hypothetical protein WD431_21100 [Cyclobacteriaceae bacterium]